MCWSSRRPARVVAAAWGLVLAAATLSFAQGFYYKEIRKDGRIYVFNVAANAERFEKSGEMGPAITRPGTGPDGETVVGDSERALQLFYYKYGIAEVVPEPLTPPPAAPAFRISGYVFGDYYGFARDHDAKFDGQQGFWIRRAYFTYDHALSPKFAARFRLEVNSNGKMAGGSLTPYVKDAYLRWTYRGQHQVLLGIHPTPAFEVLEGVWGLRYIEKMPADLYKFDSSRDFGVTLTGPVNAAGTVRYAAQVGNDSGSSSETNGNKAFRASLRYETNPGWFAEGFYLYSDRPDGADRQTVSGFAAWQHKRGRVGINYLWHERQATAGSARPDTRTTVLSALGAYAFSQGKVSVFGRIDRGLDPIPDGDIDYLPVSTVSPFTFGVVGVELAVLPSVHFAPNVEFVRYGSPERAGAARPKDDVVGRVTFYWAW